MNTGIYSRRGFSLIEIMVSLAIFSVVAVVASGAFLKIVDAGKKAQALKAVMNNLNYAIESLSRELRTGTGYACVNASIDATGNCSDTAITFESQRGDTANTADQIVYRYNSTEQSLEKSEDSGSTYYPVTAKDVKITSMVFVVTGSQIGDAIPSKVMIAIQGTTGVKEKLKSDFSLQTSVAERTRE